MPFKKESKHFKCHLDCGPTFRLDNNCVQWTALVSEWSGIFINRRICTYNDIQFKSQTAHALLRSSPACGRSTSCTAWQPDRWPGLLGSSMATGWSHPRARGSGGSSGNHGDSTGSSSRCHPDGYPARFQCLSAEDTAMGRVTITRTWQMPILPRQGQEKKKKRRRGGDGVNWWACFACRSAEYM